MAVKLDFLTTINIVLDFEPVETRFALSQLKDLGFSYARSNGHLTDCNSCEFSKVYTSSAAFSGFAYYNDIWLVGTPKDHDKPRDVTPRYAVADWQINKKKQIGYSKHINKICLKYLYSFRSKEYIIPDCDLLEKVINIFQAQLSTEENSAIHNISDLKAWATTMADEIEKKYFKLGTEELYMVINGDIIF